VPLPALLGLPIGVLGGPSCGFCTKMVYKGTYDARTSTRLIMLAHVASELTPGVRSLTNPTCRSTTSRRRPETTTAGVTHPNPRLQGTSARNEKGAYMVARKSRGPAVSRRTRGTTALDARREFYVMFQPSVCGRVVADGPLPFLTPVPTLQCDSWRTCASCLFSEACRQCDERIPNRGLASDP
jgi:hypothetical protein